MNPLYDDLNATARELIAEYGKPATLSRETTTGPDYDPTVTTTTYAVTMVETEYSMTNRDATVVQSGDKFGIISTAGESPRLSDKITIGGQTFGFIDVQPLNPGGLDLLHSFQARAA